MPLRSNTLLMGRSLAWVSWEKVCYAEDEPTWLGFYHLDDPENFLLLGTGLCPKATETKICNTQPLWTFTVASPGLGDKDSFSKNMFTQTSALSPYEEELDTEDRTQNSQMRPLTAWTLK